MQLTATQQRLLAAVGQRQMQRGTAASLSALRAEFSSSPDGPKLIKAMDTLIASLVPQHLEPAPMATGEQGYRLTLDGWLLSGLPARKAINQLLGLYRIQSVSSPDFESLTWANGIAPFSGAATSEVHLYGAVAQASGLCAGGVFPVATPEMAVRNFELRRPHNLIEIVEFDDADKYIEHLRANRATPGQPTPAASGEAPMPTGAALKGDDYLTQVIDGHGQKNPDGQSQRASPTPDGSGTRTSNVTADEINRRITLLRERRTGTQYGRWRVIRRLKEAGHQGEVLLVERAAPEYVKGVLKRLPKKRLGDQKKAQRLLREIVVIRKLNHPCIVRVIDASASDEQPWFVTPYAPLGSLHQNRCLYAGDVWRTLRIARDLASALAAAHEKAIIHRDVKPKNILLYSLDHAALTDFGIAHDPAEDTLTGTGEEVGSLWFGPPERFVGRFEPSPSFDVFSLGRVVYFVLTGGHRFKASHRSPGESVASLLARPEFEPIDGLLDRMMCNEPSERLQSMSDVVSGIDEILSRLYGRRARPRNACRVCEEGLYVVAGRPVIDENRNVLLIARAGAALSEFEPMILACNKCGDVWLRFEHVDGLAKLQPWNPSADS